MKTKQFLQFMDKVRVYDLTQRLSIHTPPWPSYMPLGIQYFKRIAGAHMGQGANGQIITTSNHVGTHMDGEIHFHASGRSIGDVPIDEWIGPGVVADISKEVGDYDLYSPEMITKNVPVKKGDILIINTGYHRYAWDQKTIRRNALFREAPRSRPRLPPMGAGHEAQMDRCRLRQRRPSDEHHHSQLASGPVRRGREKAEGEVRQGLG
jgi:kynurenine formamidase